MTKNMLFLVFAFLALACRHKDGTRPCTCDSHPDYSFKDMDYKYNNWDRRNSSFNAGFYFSYDSAFYYLKGSLKRKDTVYFVNMRGVREAEKVIHRVLLNDSITILDTLYFPETEKYSKDETHYNGTVIAPDQSRILFTYLIYPTASEENNTEESGNVQTLFILYDTGKWKKIYDTVYPSRWKTNDLAWSPDGNNILFYNPEKGDIILFDVQNRRFNSLTHEKASWISGLKWSHDNRKIYYIKDQKFLTEYDLATGRKRILHQTKNSLWAVRAINDFFVLDNDDIYVQWIKQYRFLPYMLGIVHRDCMLRNCITHPSADTGEK